jgi:fucose permease
VSGAVANVWLTNRIGFGKVGSWSWYSRRKTDPDLALSQTIVLGSLAQIVGYAFQSPAPPFPVLCIGYAFNGFGIALQDAQANGYVAELQDSAATKMGLLHAAYGVGALVSPLVATQFAGLGLGGKLPSHTGAGGVEGVDYASVRGMWGWSAHFLVSLGIAVVNLVALVWVFRFKRQPG